MKACLYLDTSGIFLNACIHSGYNWVKRNIVAPANGQRPSYPRELRHPRAFRTGPRVKELHHLYRLMFDVSTRCSAHGLSMWHSWLDLWHETLICDFHILNWFQLPLKHVEVFCFTPSSCWTVSQISHSAVWSYFVYTCKHDLILKWTIVKKKNP